MHLRLAFTINILLFTISFFKRSHCISHFQKRNIIIFFTKPDVDVNVTPIDDSGIQFLKFPVSGMVQSNDEMPQEFENIFKINLNSPDCNAIFNTYLLDLINWAIEDKRMVTATVSSEETDFSRIILKNIGSNLDGSYKNFKYTLHLPRNLITQRKATWVNTEPLDPYRNRASYSNEFDDLPLATIDPSLRGLPPLRYENHGDYIRDITAFNINNNDNDEFGFKRVRAKIEAENKSKCENNANNIEYTTTAVTTIPTSKEKNKSSENETTCATIKENTNKTAYNFLASISFFNKLQDVFMNSLLNPYEKRDSFSEENQIDSTVLGKVHENTMLKLVKSTLKSLKIQSRDHDSKINGLLMIIIGGNLSEISDPFSEFVQSVKYAVEHTNKQDTLILVTCYCPIRTLENKIEKRRIPYFAGGMDSDEFENVICMWDILDKMKTSVKKTWKKGKAKANHLISPHKNTSNKSCNNSNFTISTAKNTLTGSSMEEKTEIVTYTNLQSERKKRASDSSESSNVSVTFGVTINIIFFNIFVYYFLNG